MKYFDNCHTLDELKKEYRRLAVHSAAFNGSWCGAERQLCAVNGRGVSKVFPCQW